MSSEHSASNLQRVGGSADQGIAGIGTAPLSPVRLPPSRCRRSNTNEPGSLPPRRSIVLKEIPRQPALSWLWWSRLWYSEPARRAASTARLTVDLIDGDRLCDLIAGR